MTKLTEEKEIKRLLRTDEKSQKAFDKMLNYYQIYDKIHFTRHAKLIEAIYIDNRHRYLWELAEIGGMCYSSYFEYRKKYIECFYLCLE